MQAFTNAALHVSTIDQTIYECLTNEDSTVHNLLITNNSDVATVNINLKLQKNSDSFFCIPSGFELRPKNTLELKPINLAPGDKLIISANQNSICDVVASILKEIRDF